MLNNILQLKTTDWFILIAFFVIYMFGLDPLFIHLDVYPIVKHIPFLFFFAAYLLYFIGSKLNVNSTKNREMVINYGLLFFSSLVSIGSITGRYLYGVDNTFLNMGVFSMLCLSVSYFSVLSCQPIVLFRMIICVWFFTAVLAFINQIKFFHVDSVIHNHEHMIIPFFVLLYLYFNRFFYRVLFLFFFLLLCLGAHKNTSYILYFFAIMYVFIVSMLHKISNLKDNFFRLFYFLSIFLCGALSVIVLSVGYIFKDSLFPTGNPTYRLRTYEIAFDKFLESPLFGNFFTAPATEMFTGFQVAAKTQILPTHSDPLDILANGGVVGLLLFFSIYVILLIDVKKYNVFSAFKSRVDGAILHFLLFTIFSGLFVCAFNPILNTPNSAFSYWISLGILYGYISCAKLNEMAQLRSEV